MESALDLSFGFDNPNFSDRTLILEIIDNGFAPPPRVKAVYISSLILAARSPYFYKLFSNGMQETEQQYVTLRIEALEEVSFMDLLKYVYSNTLPTTLTALLDLLFTADKFEVVSCSRDCTRALKNLPMTCESASFYLDLPPGLLISPALHPLIDAANKFLVAKFEVLNKFEKELLDLPLHSFQAIIASDDLMVTSETVVYDCVLKWARKHYPDLEERREILKMHLLHLVRFSFMTATQLTNEVQTCNDIDSEIASKIVTEILVYDSETDSHQRRSLALDENNSVPRQYASMDRPIKVELHDLPHQHCVVYLELTRKELKRISIMWFEHFQLDGRVFVLYASSSLNVPYNFKWTLFVLISSTCTVNYEFAVRMSPQGDFGSWFKGSHTFSVTNNVKDIHDEELSGLTGDDSPFFINDILHVRAEVTINK